MHVSPVTQITISREIAELLVALGSASTIVTDVRLMP